MVVAIVRLLLISLISLPLWAADNTVEVRTKGSGTEILVDQIGAGNTARVWCGLSDGTFDTHLCTNAFLILTKNDLIFLYIISF